MMDETTGERIARLRERKHWTQKELSEATDRKVSEAWIAAMEKDRIKRPWRDTLGPLATALGVPEDYLTKPLRWVPYDGEETEDATRRGLEDDDLELVEQLADHLRQIRRGGHG